MSRSANLGPGHWSNRTESPWTKSTTHSLTNYPFLLQIKRLKSFLGWFRCLSRVRASIVSSVSFPLPLRSRLGVRRGFVRKRGASQRACPLAVGIRLLA